MRPFISMIMAAAFWAAFFMPVAEAGGWVTGPVRGLNPRLVAGLHRMHMAFHKTVIITPHGGCRLHGNRLAPRSYHRIAAGCKAADVIVPGVSRQAILRWWARHMGGGRGFYCGRRFVHVDVGPRRTWKWFCRKPRTRLARRQ